MSILKTVMCHIIKCNRPRPLGFNSLMKVQARTLTSDTSGLEKDPGNQIDYEVVHNPEEWKYVERLLPSKWIPDPKPKTAYHSGWKPQTAVADEFQYFIERTKNHQLPVYLEILMRGTARRTVIRRIEGDMWKLAEELVDYLKTQKGEFGRYHTVGVKVEELKRTITLRGDYVEYTKKFLLDRGF